MTHDSFSPWVAIGQGAMPNFLYRGLDRALAFSVYRAKQFGWAMKALRRWRLPPL